jgi:microcystin-dependent protein
MPAQYLGEIRVVGFNFAPTGWAHCNGQLLPITQNTSLFSILGTTYGGNGADTFALPNIQSRVVMAPGQGPGLSEYFLGETGGANTVSLLSSEIPSHAHAVRASANSAPLQAPAPDRSLGRSTSGFAYQSNSTQNLTRMASQALSQAGGGQPHENRTPVVVLKYIIAIQGIFPPRP